MMKQKSWCEAVIVLLALATVAPILRATETSRYDVVWTTPSKSCHGSMPLGNGDIGLNAWVEKNGDLCFYISNRKTSMF